MSQSPDFQTVVSKAVSIFIPAFCIILVVNQLGYGSCFKFYCLSAAFPKVLLFSVIVSFVISYFISEKPKSKHQENLNEQVSNSIPEQVKAKAKEDIERVAESDRTSIDNPIVKQSKKREKAYSISDIRKEYKNAYKPWTEEDDEKLKMLHSQGKSIKELYIIFQRQPGGVRSRLKKHDLL